MEAALASGATLSDIFGEVDAMKYGSSSREIFGEVEQAAKASEVRLPIEAPLNLPLEGRSKFGEPES